MMEDRLTSDQIVNGDKKPDTLGRVVLHSRLTSSFLLESSFPNPLATLNCVHPYHPNPLVALPHLGKNHDCILSPSPTSVSFT